jgi:ribosome biogenesis protein UTP30
VKKDRDYERTIRKYKRLIDKHALGDLVKMILPVKQLKQEFRPYEAKRKLCTSFEVFIADKCLHDVLYNGSQLGREFQKRKK